MADDRKMAKPFKGRAPNFQAFWWPFEATLPPFDIQVIVGFVPFKKPGHVTHIGKLIS